MNLRFPPTFRAVSNGIDYIHHTYSLFSEVYAVPCFKQQQLSAHQLPGQNRSSRYAMNKTASSSLIISTIIIPAEVSTYIMILQAVVVFKYGTLHLV